MATTAQIEANRANSLRSTGPKTADGKARVAQNALSHGLTARKLVAIPRGPFVEDQKWVEDFCGRIVDELKPETFLEVVEAEHIARLCLRIARLAPIEAIALAGATRVRLLPPAGPNEPHRVLEGDQEAAAGAVFASQLLQLLPRYEGHLTRELDRALARYRTLRQREREVGGVRVIEGGGLPALR